MQSNNYTILMFRQIKCKSEVSNIRTMYKLVEKQSG